MDQRDVVEHSVEAFVAEVVALTLDGWAVSETCPGDAVGFGQCYTVSMFRDVNTVESFRLRAVNIEEKPKRTRAEQLAEARAMRGKGKLALEVVQ